MLVSTTPRTVLHFIAAVAIFWPSLEHMLSLLRRLPFVLQRTANIYSCPTLKNWTRSAVS